MAWEKLFSDSPRLVIDAQRVTGLVTLVMVGVLVIGRARRYERSA